MEFCTCGHPPYVHDDGQMRAWYGDDAVYWFCKLSAVKYLSRAGKKGDAAEDLQKARWYAEYAASIRSSK